MRFDLEHRGEPLADVDGTRVLSGSLQDLWPFGRERPQVNPGALVTAVLGPHHGENAELRQVRLTAEERDDALVLVGLEAVTIQNLRIDHARATSAPDFND